MDSSKEILRTLYPKGKAVQSRANLYDVNRGMIEKPFVDSYVEDLPTFEGKNVHQILEQSAGEENFRILDVGCGQANFLAEVSEEFGPAFSYEGINTYPYHDEARLNKLNVHVDIGDIQHIFRRNQYNLIVAEQSLQYTENPLLALKRIYSALKPDGIALIFPLHIEFKYSDEQKRFVDYMQQKYKFVFSPKEGRLSSWKLAFRKTQSSLQIPVSIIGVKNFQNPWIEQEQVIYRLRGAA